MINRKYDIVVVLVIILVIAFSFPRCAKVVAPSGGPRDTIPPVPINTEPPNYSTNFNSEKIEIEFNEFLQFKEMTKQFIASPPFEEKPEIKLKGKDVEIRLWGKLDGNTTYTLNFGNAIRDFTENNPIKNFRYVFSTGDCIDSMAIAGIVKDAFTLEPMENVTVMLYDDLTDSIPYRKIPDYVARTDEKGQFFISNIRKDTFKLFALHEMNNNYLYDNYTEKIGFTDSLVTFEQELFEEQDTIFVENDSIEKKDRIIDTVKEKTYYDYPVNEYAIKMFQEDKGEQYLKTGTRPRAMKLNFVFNRPVWDTLKLNVFDTISHKEQWFFKEMNQRKDTIEYWITDSSLYNREYLPIYITYKKKDSLHNEIWTTDSIELRYVSKKNEWIDDSVSLSPSIKNNQQIDLNQTIYYSSEIPLTNFKSEGFCLYEVKDSVYKEETFTASMDHHHIFIRKDWKSNKKYRLVVLPETVSFLYDFYQEGPDTLDFKTRSSEEYGDMLLRLKNIDTSYIIHLLKGEDKVVRKAHNSPAKENVVEFNYLDPGDYKIRLIVDRNNNGKWDTGDYLKHKQPEIVIYYDEKIEIRANWDHEFEWNLNMSNREKIQ